MDVPLNMSHRFNITEVIQSDATCCIMENEIDALVFMQ